MKPTRIIEKVAYGDGTPDNLADPVPTWDVLTRERLRAASVIRVVGRWVVSRLDVWDEDPSIGDLTEIEARWWAAVAIAHAAGCPPHWADLGFVVPRDYFYWVNGTTVVWESDGGRWVVVASGGERRFDTEIEARIYATTLLSSETEPA